MNADSPFEGDVPRDGDEPSYRWLDEWLCEYVDGTMDPSLEAVFEQYVEANPELEAHIERLKKTRDLLCSCGLPKEPAPDVEAEVCQEVECDLPRSSTSEEKPTRNPSVARFGLVSSVTAALVIGFLVGAVVVRPVPPVVSSEGPSTDPAAEAESPSPAQRTMQAPERERPELLLRPSAASVSAIDSTQSPSTITTIGTP